MNDSDLIHQARQALQSNNRPTARRLLTQALRENPRSVEAWLLMANVVEQKEHQLDCLMRVLALQPHHQIAQEKLARLTATAAPSIGRQAGSSPAISTPSASSHVETQVKEAVRSSETHPGSEARRSNEGRRRERPPQPVKQHILSSHDEKRRKNGYRNIMFAGALTLSAFCGLMLLVVTLTTVVPRGQALRQERLKPTPEPILYEATLWCPPCEQSRSPVILWEKVGDGASRGGKAGELPHNTTITVHVETWSEPEKRFYFKVSANGQKGWVPETFIKR